MTLNHRTIAMISILLGGLLQGCGHLSNPVAPAPSNNLTATPTPMTTPRYAMAFPVGKDPGASYPAGVAFDPTQNVLYVTDTNLNLVYKFNTNGGLLAQWGDQGVITLDQPQAVAVHNGNVYVADASNSRIVEYDPNGNVITTLQPTDGQFYLFIYPTGLFFDNQGNLYVADNSDEIYQFDQNLTLTGQYNGGNTLNFPANACQDANGNIFVANYNSDQVLKLQSNGMLAAAWGQPGAGVGQFEGPSDVKTDSKGNIYVVDSINDRIQVLDANGKYQAQWGASEGLSEPNSMAFDSNGNLYVVDSGNSRIVEYTPAN